MAPVGKALWLVRLGIGLGVVAALALSRALRTLPVQPTAPFTFATVSLLLLATALSAC